MRGRRRGDPAAVAAEAFAVLDVGFSKSASLLDAARKVWKRLESLIYLFLYIKNNLYPGRGRMPIEPAPGWQRHKDLLSSRSAWFKCWGSANIVQRTK